MEATAPFRPGPRLVERIEFGPSAPVWESGRRRSLSHILGPNIPLSLGPRVLFISAKKLLVEAESPTGPGTKTFDLDQNL